MNTKDRILDTALQLFSASGYDAVSIRDICGEVGIKESSLYYHFKNKRDILDSLMQKFEDHVNALLQALDAAELGGGTPLSFDWMDEYFFDRYLFDPFCNGMMRLMLIEQLHNEQIRAAYERWLFAEPYRIETAVFSRLAEAGILSDAQAARAGRDYWANMTALTFRYLLNGELSEARKAAFRVEAHACVASMFAGIGGNQNG